MRVVLKCLKRLVQIPMDPEESDIIKDLRELVLVDKSYENILIGMEKFHTHIRQYSWSIENFDGMEKNIWH